MKIVGIEYIIAIEPTVSGRPWKAALRDVRTAVRSVVWPTGNDGFVLNPDRGRGRGQGNGVKPIKDSCMLTLESLDWQVTERTNPYRLDACRSAGATTLVGLEWETGNISSSHRSVNRLLRGLSDGVLLGGILIVPSRSLYHYLTDRVGNIDELWPYIPLWQRYPLSRGVLAFVIVEHDGTDPTVPRIPKGTDGRALA